jgi:putative addiction module antidote
MLGRGNQTVKLRIRGVGTSAGIVIPKRELERLGLKKGDIVILTESPDGFRVNCGDPEFEEDMRLARKFMRRRRNLLRELARN